MNFLSALVILIIAGYFFIVFFLSRFFVPFMGFRKYLPPAAIPDDVQQTIRELEEKSKNVRSYLENAYQFVRSNWQAERLKTVTHFPLIFRTDLGAVWRQRGYAHCNTINFILYTLLAKSRYFAVEDIKVRHSFFNMVLHQYLQVKVSGQWIDVDSSVAYLKNPVGRRAHLFG